MCIYQSHPTILSHTFQASSATHHPTPAPWLSSLAVLRDLAMVL